MIRVLIADDHAVVRQGLRTYLELQDDVEVVAEAATARGGRARRRGTRPTSCCSTSRCRGSTASRAAPSCASAPEARVIVLTSFGEDDRLFAALRGGAAGFLLKDTEPADLVRAIRTAHAGQSPLSPRSRRAWSRSSPRRPPARGRPAHAARARGPAADRARALEQADRARARRGGEDGQDARRPPARQARPHRPHAGSRCYAVREAAAPGGTKG